MASTIVGLFDSRDTARRVAEELERSGCRDVNISAAEGQDVSTTQSEGKHGGFLSWLLGDNDEDSATYDEGIRRGRTAVSATAEDERLDEICAVMNRYSPLDIERESAQWRQEGWTGRRAAEAGSESIPVIEEQVEIGARAVQRGGLRVYSRVVERPVEKDVTLHEEKVDVQRRKVDRPVTAADRAMQDRVIEKRETGEEAVVSKTARVVEEVGLMVEEQERRQRIKETERHTEVEVERLGKEGRSDPDRPRTGR